MHPPTAIEGARQKLQAFIRAQGLKHTRQREEILEAFVAAGGHVSVEELLRAAAARSPGLGHATLYRTMRLFVDAGIAHERNFGDGQTRYEPVLPDEHHDHLICLDCNRIFEFEDPTIEARQAEICRVHGLLPQHHRHEIYARCQQGIACPHRAR